MDGSVKLNFLTSSGYGPLKQHKQPYNTNNNAGPLRAHCISTAFDEPNRTSVRGGGGSSTASCTSFCVCAKRQRQQVCGLRLLPATSEHSHLDVVRHMLALHLHSLLTHRALGHGQHALLLVEASAGPAKGGARETHGDGAQTITPECAVECHKKASRGHHANSLLPDGFYAPNARQRSRCAQGGRHCLRQAGTSCMHARRYVSLSPLCTDGGCKAKTSRVLSLCIVPDVVDRSVMRPCLLAHAHAYSRTYIHAHTITRMRTPARSFWGRPMRPRWEQPSVCRTLGGRAANRDRKNVPNFRHGRQRVPRHDPQPLLPVFAFESRHCNKLLEPICPHMGDAAMMLSSVVCPGPSKFGHTHWSLVVCVYVCLRAPRVFDAQNNDSLTLLTTCARSKVFGQKGTYSRTRAHTHTHTHTHTLGFWTKRSLKPVSEKDLSQSLACVRVRVRVCARVASRK